MLSLLTPSHPAAQETSPDEVVGSQEEGLVVDDIVVWATVDDKRGRPKTELSAKDFTVYDDGRAQVLTGFELGKATLLSVQMLFDASGSMELSGRMVPAKAAALFLLARLRQGDEASLWSFARRQTSRECEMGTPLRTIGDAIQVMRGEGETTLRDSIFRSLLAPEGSTRKRRAIFLFTDGLDNASETDEESLAILASTLNVAIHAIIFSPRPERDTEPQLYAGIRRISELSGGTSVVIFPFDDEGPVDAITAALERLESSYVLEYSPEGARRKGFHRIEVKVDCKGCTVLHRSGYHAR